MGSGGVLGERSVVGGGDGYDGRVGSIGVGWRAHSEEPKWLGICRDDAVKLLSEDWLKAEGC